MEALHNINFASLVDSFVSVASAFFFGGIIGFERQYRQRTAGLRTNVLVAVGAAIFVDMADRLDGHGGAVRVVSYVVSGIGFLGAGVIMREQGNVRGLNTAATLWCSAAVGACCGADLVLEALVGTVFVLMANTLLRPIVGFINRQPLNAVVVESSTTLYVIVKRSEQQKAHAFLQEQLAGANYPVREIKTHSFGQDEVEMEVALTAELIEEKALDEFIQRLCADDSIVKAFWSHSLIE